jgi:hypothetical protein
MIATSDGVLWSDFELVTLGAVESDLAMVGPDDIEVYNAVAESHGLRRVDGRVLRITEAAGRLGMVAALAMAPQLPMLVDAVEPMMDVWRTTPPVTEI